MNEPFRILSELQSAIGALPPVAPGCHRVRRGQTTDYPQMLPGGLRASIRNRAIWQVYCQHLHLDMLPDAIGADGRVELAALQAMCAARPG
jgi:hypothetical protein